jgi:hypothetical protein
LDKGGHLAWDVIAVIGVVNRCDGFDFLALYVNQDKT